MARRRILILGGGYGGLACLRGLSRRLERRRYELTLVDASSHHTIKTRFHERAVLPGRDALLRFPLELLAGASGADFRRDRVERLDLDARGVYGVAGSYEYDLLVLALGGQIAHFGVPGAAQHTVSLQTYADACACAERLAALTLDAATPPRVAVCGAGVEGLEVAAMVRQYAGPERCRVAVVERSETVMARSQCDDAQRRYLLRYLERHAIETRFGATIEAVEPGLLRLSGGRVEAADLVYWCAGVERVPVLGTGRGGPFRVTAGLQHAAHPEVFGLGDFVTVDSPEPYANLASAQRAVYQGGLVAANLARVEAGRAPRPARYRPVGELIGLGDLDGVGSAYGVPLRGVAAAAAKKGNEALYLRQLFRDLPGAVVRGLRAVAGY